MTHRSLVLVAILSCGAVISEASQQAAEPKKDPPNNATSMIRSQLEGRWTLVALDMYSADGKHITPEATGRLDADEYGNLNVEYRMSEAGRKQMAATIGIVQPTPIVSTTGKVVVNPQNHQIVYVDQNQNPFDAKIAADKQNPFSLHRIRYYQFEGEFLVLTTRHDNDKPAAVSRWKRME